MNDLPRLLPWIGGPADGLGGTAFSPLVSPIDESVACQMIESDADRGDAATRIAGAGFEASGQQCISAQRVIVERAVYGASGFGREGVRYALEELSQWKFTGMRL